MAANQTSNHRNKPGTARSQGNQSARRHEPEHEDSSGTLGAISDMAGQASDYVTEGASQAQECIREHSGSAVAISLVAGFGVGLLIGRALGSTQQPEPRSRRYRAAAEGVGRRLMDRIEAMIPDALAEHFGK